jgi:hypothetical protein
VVVVVSTTPTAASNAEPAKPAATDFANMMCLPGYKMVRREQMDATAVPVDETYFGNRGTLSFQGSPEHSSHAAQGLPRPDSKRPLASWAIRPAPGEPRGLIVRIRLPMRQQSRLSAA